MSTNCWRKREHSQKMALSLPEHRIVSGDIFASGAQTLGNAVNCRGVMGAGIAKVFRERYPTMFADYRKRCQAGEVVLGRPYLWTSANASQEPRVLNFPTKDHWQESSRLQPIVDGLLYLRAHYHEWGITSLALPALGCGLGGLTFAEMQPLLVEHLREFDIPVLIYRPRSAS